LFLAALLQLLDVDHDQDLFGGCCNATTLRRPNMAGLVKVAHIRI
jgi:hypothetical protein